MTTGFTELRVPLYSKTLVDEHGKPLLIGHFPVRIDPCMDQGRIYLLNQKEPLRCQSQPG